jgi:hypothetical protein
MKILLIITVLPDRPARESGGAARLALYVRE